MDLSMVRRLVAPAPARKASRANAVTLLNVPMPGPITHPNYEKLSKETFQRNVTVYSCVMGIASNAATVPWVAFEKSKATGNPLKARRIMSPSTAQKAFLFDGRRKHAVRKSLESTDVRELRDVPALRLLERPNAVQSQTAYLTNLIAYFLLSGNAYEEFVATKAKGAVPEEMYTLRPDRTEVIANTPTNRGDAKYAELVAARNPATGKPAVSPTDLVLGYCYSAGGHYRDLVFPTDAVIHRKFFHPTDDFYGFGPLQAAQRAWQTDNLATDWNYALIKNQARPGGALIAPTELADDASFERIKAEIIQGTESATGTGRPMFLEGGLKWEQFSFSPLELDWAGGKAMTQIDICSVFRWPPELIGSMAHRTFNSMPEARRAGWIDAILPILDVIRDEYNARLAPRFGDQIFYDYDRDQIDALAEDQQRVWLRVGGADFLSINEQRDAVGYELHDDPEADVPRALTAAANPAPGGFSPEEPDGEQGDDKPDGDKPKPQPGEPQGDQTLRAAEKALLSHRALKQRLTSRQRRQLSVLRAAMKRFFKGQGAEIGRYVGEQIAKEL